MSQATSVVAKLNILWLSLICLIQKNPNWVLRHLKHWEAQNLGCFSEQIYRIGTVSSLWEYWWDQPLTWGGNPWTLSAAFPLLPSTHPYMKASLNVLAWVTFSPLPMLLMPLCEKRSGERVAGPEHTPAVPLRGTGWRRHFCIPLVGGEQTISDFWMFWKCCDIFALREHHFFHSFMVLGLLFHFEVQMISFS